MSFISETISSDSTSLLSNQTKNDVPSEAHPLALSELSAGLGRVRETSCVQSVLSSVNPLHQVKTTLRVCVGSAAITVGELLGAKEHQVLVLDRSVLQPVDLVLEGHVVARGQLVAVGNQFAVRITELSHPLNTGFPDKP